MKVNFTSHAGDPKRRAIGDKVTAVLRKGNSRRTCSNRRSAENRELRRDNITVMSMSCNQMLLGKAKVSIRQELLFMRKCKRCGWEGPAHLEYCRICPGILDKAFQRQLALVTPEITCGEFPATFGPVAALGCELSGQPIHTEALKGETESLLSRLIQILPATAIIRSLDNGVLLAIIRSKSLTEAATSAARAAMALNEDTRRLERRIGIAVGLLNGAKPEQAGVVGLAAQLARSAASGQILTGFGTARLLDHDWQFGPAGVLSRRQEDVAKEATSLLGPKLPAPTPSALVPDKNGSLVGRKRELAILQNELTRVFAGENRWCALIAPAGAGKSKLLRTWISRLDQDDASIIGASGTPFGQAPLSVVSQLLDSLGTPVPSNSSEEEALSALLTGIEHSVQVQPLLVLIDDLHWSDAESLAILRLLHSHPLHRCLVVVALRSSFLPSVPWLIEGSQHIELPPLTRNEREDIVHHLLPDDAAVNQRAELVKMDKTGNPLYLEQAAAYIKEAGPKTALPASLHQAVLWRLELVLERVDRRGYQRLSPSELAAIELTVNEWLDRLETGDYDDRKAVSTYLSLLERIDASLVIASSIAGVPLKRNRRLAATIDRFYSASFAERVEVIEHLAKHDLTNAAFAARYGGDRSVKAVRLKDACSYYELAARFMGNDQKWPILVELGDIFLLRGMVASAEKAYVSAKLANPNDEFLARCNRRLARTSLAHGQHEMAFTLLERARSSLSGNERAILDCDLAYVLMLLGDAKRAQMVFERVEHLEVDSKLKSFICRTRLRLAILSGVTDLAPLVLGCVNSLVLENDILIDLAALIETTILLNNTSPNSLDPTLVAESVQAAHRIGNLDLGKRLVTKSVEMLWRPIHAVI